MVIKLLLVGGHIELFKTEQYKLSTVKEMHPDILKVWVYSDEGKLLAKRQRLFKKFYVKYKYKPLPIEETEQQDQEEEKKEE